MKIKARETSFGKIDEQITSSNPFLGNSRGGNYFDEMDLQLLTECRQRGCNFVIMLLMLLRLMKMTRMMMMITLLDIIHKLKRDMAGTSVALQQSDLRERRRENV